MFSFGKSPITYNKKEVRFMSVPPFLFYEDVDELYANTNCLQLLNNTSQFSVAQNRSKFIA